MDLGEKLGLVKRNTCEIISEEELVELLSRKKKPVVYLGTAITGRPHIGYFLWVNKLGDFLKAGFKVKLLLADLHGALDNTSWEVLEKRYNYYKAAIPLMFRAINVDVKELEIIKGSSFQLEKKYCLDVLKMSTFSSVNDCKRAASEVVKFGDNPKLSGLIYPIMQALDEEYLNVDVQYGGADQRKIFVFARENLPKIGYKARVEVMTPLIPGLIGKKMSSSEEDSKIDLLDDENAVKNKVNKAECVEGSLDNGLLPFVKYVIMTLKNDRNEKFIVERSPKFGGNMELENYHELEKSFVQRKLHPQDLKNSIAREINSLLKLMRENKELKRLSKEAYG